MTSTPANLMARTCKFVLEGSILLLAFSFLKKAAVFGRQYKNSVASDLKTPTTRKNKKVLPSPLLCANLDLYLFNSFFEHLPQLLSLLLYLIICQSKPTDGVN